MGVGNSGSSCGNADLGPDVLDVRRHGLGADEQGIRDSLVGVSLGKQTQYIKFP